MYIGIPSDALDTHFAHQRNGMWCWAACIEMLFEMHGVGVSQEMIVDRHFGSLPGQMPPNKPGDMMHMHASLNHYGIDYNGRHYEVISSLYPGPPSPATIVRELEARKPMLLSYRSRPSMNHAVLLTGAELVDERPGLRRLRTLIVRDPWPKQENLRKRGRIEHAAKDLVAKTVAHWIVRIAR
jgi:hypothetical protein